MVLMAVFMAEATKRYRKSCLCIHGRLAAYAKVCHVPSSLTSAIYWINSAYLNVPITVKRVYVSETPDPRPIPTSETPLIQHRRVHLRAAPESLRNDESSKVDEIKDERTIQPRVVCIATSVVRIASEPAAKRFLDEKYAIGQVFRILGRVVSVPLSAPTFPTENRFSFGRPTFTC